MSLLVCWCRQFGGDTGSVGSSHQGLERLSTSIPLPCLCLAHASIHASSLFSLLHHHLPQTYMTITHRPLSTARFLERNDYLLIGHLPKGILFFYDFWQRFCWLHLVRTGASCTSKVTPFDETKKPSRTNTRFHLHHLQCMKSCLLEPYALVLHS